MENDTDVLKTELENDRRDVADIWNDALIKYKSISKVDLQKLPMAKFVDSEAMVKYGEDQMKGWDHFRNRGEKVDKLRGVFKDCMWYIQTGVSQVAAAATPVFPPAAAIGTALNYMLSACKQVSADYDVVTDFFEDMLSFLQRTSILQSRLPDQPAFRNCLMDVFTSLLEMCSFATKYIQKDRFKKWVTNMVKGEDSELQKARKTMETSVKRLQSATEFAILGNVEETKRMSAELQRIQEAQNNRLESIDRKQDQILANIQYFIDFSTLRSKREEPKDKESSWSRSKKATNANVVKNWFYKTMSPMVEYYDIKFSLVQGTCGWLFGEAAWKTWATQPKGFLALSGPPGSGKSCLAASAYDELVRVAGQNPESHTVVACFFFREANKDLASLEYAIPWITIQIAEKNDILCEKMVAKYEQDEFEWDAEDWEKVWNGLVAPILEKESKFHIQIVLDGVDELDKDQRKFLTQWLHVIQDKSLNISVLYTTRPEGVCELDDLNADSISIDKEKLAPDLHTLVWNRLSRSDRLRRFSRSAKHKIADRIEEKADGILYAAHMLRRYDTIGRETAVLKDMSSAMPSDLEELYEILLADCARRTPREQLETLRGLFAWVAYSVRPLTLEELNSLKDSILQDNQFSIEDELQGRLAGILQLVEPIAADSDDLISTQTARPSKVLIPDKLDELRDEGKLPLRFQERSLRGFFRSPAKVDQGLKTSPSIAHVWIFTACSQILCDKISEPTKPVNKSLRQYAARNWLTHLLNIAIFEPSESEKTFVIENLAAILSNENNIALTFEQIGVDYTALLKGLDSDWVGQCIYNWANLGATIDETKLSSVASKWALQFTQHYAQRQGQDPPNVWIPLAKAHIKNWFQASDVELAKKSFHYARSAMLKIQPHYDKEGVEAKTDEGDEGNEDDDDNDDEAGYSEKAIAALRDAFKDIELDSKAHWAIAVIFNLSNHYDAALLESMAASAECHDAVMKFRILELMAQIQLNLEKEEDAYQTITNALAANDTSVIAPALLREGLITRAKAEAQCEKLDEAAKSYDDARRVCPEDRLPGDVLQATAEIYEKKGDYLGLISTIKSWPTFDRATWLAWEYSEQEEAVAHVLFRKAAAKAGEQDFMMQTYKEVIQLLDERDSGAPMRLELATAHVEILKDFATAKLILNEILDSDSTGDSYELTEVNPGWVLTHVINFISDVIYEEFRSATDRKLKASLLEELKGLKHRRLARSIASPDVDNIHHFVVLARMLGKMGPMQEYHDTLDKAFNVCYEALTDSVEWNDSYTLGNLVEILAELGGLDKEALIAVSAIYSTLEPDDSPDGKQNEDEDPDADDDDDEEEEEDDDENTYCDGICEPRVEWSSWDDQALYACLICYDCSLCKACYERRQSSNSNGQFNSWKNYCGRNHRYIKGPIEGWQGIENGVMMIEGAEPVKFREWLDELKDVKWRNAWDRFWDDERIMGNIGDKDGEKF